MEPRIKNVQIQYVSKKDGTAATFYILGHGPPLIYMPGGPFRALELLATQASTYRSSLDGLTKGRTVITYERGGAAVSNKEGENPLETPGRAS